MQPIDAEAKPFSPRWPRLTAVVVALAVFVVLFFIQLPPSTLLGKADLVGYGICHRIPERSFHLAGRQLPLCARCTGTFLGAFIGLTAMLLLRRQKASRLPPISVLGMLILFVGIWGFDGVNSYLTLFPGAPHLYEPRNWLRLTTGMLNGLALISFVFPIFNYTIWASATPERVFRSLRELLVLLPPVALIIWVIQAELDLLLYPLALLSSLGVMLMLVLINSMVAAVVLGLEGRARTWRQALIPLSVGAALAIVQISVMTWLRAYLTARFGLSF